uniref:Uncharacterized protein n=1 Tax=Daphnia galeata TaxID=27404 RepID=A0A8J2RYU2_9CRUS|nr:unnamed protein product [Daphnia galeata]
MPQVKSVKSLTEICIDFIVESQKFFSEKLPLGVLEDCADALDSDKPAINPFDELPSGLLEELVRILKKKESSDIYPHRYKITPLFKLLVTPRLRTLDLTTINENCDISDVLHLATIRCPNLETLRFDYTTSQYVGSFNFIPKFTFRLPETGDDCFYLIGKHCPALRELYCEGCQATDDGILKLCVVGNCKSIRKLNLESCFKTLLECLAIIAQTAIDQKLSLPKYSLSALYILHNTIYKSGSLQQSVLLCPDVTEVYLTARKRGLKDTDLRSLLSLEKLYTIEFSHGIILGHLPGGSALIDRELSFDGVVPLLKKFGNYLKKIFMVRNHSDITSESLLTLLSSPSLSHIELFMALCNTLTDNVIQMAAKIHSFRNLECLHLFHCNLVTKKGIDIFWKESNPLREIRVCSLNYHSGFTKEDLIDWNNNAIWIQKNWQFQLIFTCFYKHIYLGGHIWEGEEPEGIIF